MAKRVFKNKRLMRSILILAGFLIVGFFLWTILFKNTKIFEGQTTQSPAQSTAPTKPTSSTPSTTVDPDIDPLAAAVQNLTPEDKKKWDDILENTSSQRSQWIYIRSALRKEPPGPLNDMSKNEEIIETIKALY